VGLPHSNLGLVKSGNSKGAPILGFRRWDDSEASDGGMVPEIWLKLRSSVATRGDRVWRVGSVGTELRRMRCGAWSSAARFDSSGLEEEAKAVGKELRVGARRSGDVDRAVWGRATGRGEWAEEARHVVERPRARERRHATERSGRMGSACECSIFGSHGNRDG
jgi:hypothetical protein